MTGWNDYVTVNTYKRGKVTEKSSEHTILSWKAPEFLHYKKNSWWFPIMAAVTLALTTIFLLTSQYIVAIIVILGAIVMYRLAHQEPAVSSVTFTATGIKFKGQLIPFSALKTFWILEKTEVKRLYLQKTERFSAPVVIPLIQQDINKVRDFLEHFLPETHDVEEDIADKLNRLLRI